MKNLHVFRSSIFLLLVSIMLSSCGVKNRSDFTSQKYTHFKKGETVSNHQPAAVQKKHETATITEFAEPQNTDVILVASNSELPVRVMTPVSETKSLSPGVSNNAASNFMNKVKVKVNHVISFDHKSLFNANTASVKSGDVDLIVLVILAILLPPLSVFLVKGIAPIFWLDLILTFFFWIPGVILALLVAFGAV